MSVFRVALPIIEKYERISCAKLNLEKSIIMQLDEGPQPI